MTAAINSEPVQVIYIDVEPIRGAKGFGSQLEKVTRVGVLDVTCFKAQLVTICSQIEDTLKDVAPATSTFQLDSFEVTVDVTAKGEVRLVGSVGAELKGGVKIVFKRR